MDRFLCFIISGLKNFTMNLNGTHQLLIYADAVNLTGKNINTMKKIQKLY